MKKLLNVLFVTLPDAFVNLDYDNVCVKLKDEILLRVPLLNLEQLILFNHFGATPQLLGECAKRNISVSFLSEYGKYISAPFTVNLTAMFCYGGNNTALQMVPGP